jgi:hypothetical protein
VEIQESMKSMEIRILMKNFGWESKDSITQTAWKNGYCFSVWFERWDWHDISVGEVCLHTHSNNLDEMDIITYNLAKKALKACNFINEKEKDYEIQKMYEKLSNKIWEK